MTKEDFLLKVLASCILMGQPEVVAAGMITVATAEDERDLGEELNELLVKEALALADLASEGVELSPKEQECKEYMHKAVNKGLVH